jgi:dihydrofolate reductase
MKGIIYIASSVNGYITQGDTDSSWVSEEDGMYFTDLCTKIGAVIVGGTTYEQFKGELYPMPNTYTVVMTKKDIEESVTVQKAATLTEALEILQAKDFSQFLIAGGATLLGSSLREGVVDEVLVSIHPLVIGSGLSMFKGFAGIQKLVFKEVVKASEQHVVLRYIVQK